MSSYKSFPLILPEGVAEAGEASGRPRRMSKDGSGGAAADSEPVPRA